MSRRFVLERDYYEEGVNLYKKKTVTIDPGVTVLVGCNGIGKTTFLRQLRSKLKNQIYHILSMITCIMVEVTLYQRQDLMRILRFWQQQYNLQKEKIS